MIIGFAAPTVRADDQPAEPPGIEVVVGQFDRGEYGAALESIAASLRRRPDDPVMLYNAACAHARLGNAEISADYLLKAVKAGFMDFSHMRRDPDLAAVRAHPRFRALLAARDAADPLLAGRLLDHWQDRLRPSGYVSAASEIEPVTAICREQPDQMVRLIELETDRIRRRLFGTAAGGHRVLVVVLADQEAPRWLPDPHARGRYSHRRRELIARGEGPALRHELAHMLHHRDMDRLGQEHPIWIQEALASVFEDVIEQDGEWRIQPNERRNVIKHLARRGRLIPWSDLMTMDRLTFERRRIETYAHARSIATFIATSADLKRWYELYVDGFEDDPTGRAALETLFGAPLERIEHRWRAWLALQPTVIEARGGVSRPEGISRQKARTPASVQ